jgi:chromosome segregation ATPase
MAGFRGYRPPPQVNPLDSRALERIDRALGTIGRKLERLTERHDALDAKLTRIIDAQARAEEEQMAQNEAVQRLVQEVAETRGQVNSMVTFVRGVPDLVRAAVQEALAANPALSPEDLAAITQAADDLDAAQGEIVSALNANSGGAEPSEPEPAPAPVEEPTT